MDQKKPEDFGIPSMEPIISAIVNNKCDVTLHLGNSHFYNDSNDPGVDNSKNESGFFINRSQDGKPFERIATLPAVTNPDSWEYYHGYRFPINSGWLPLLFRRSMRLVRLPPHRLPCRWMRQIVLQKAGG